MRTKLAFVGIDIGTQGVRAAALLENGELCSGQSYPFAKQDAELMRREQNPELWWQAAVLCLRKVAADIRKRSDPVRIHGITVSSTSGTVIPLGKGFAPLHPALMYGDTRSAEAAEWCSRIAGQSGEAGARFTSSYGLPKIVWFQRTNPHLAEKVQLWAHAADFIVGRLSGAWGVTDHTNGFKTGYLLEQEKWPDYISRGLGIPEHALPKVAPTGTIVGRVSLQASELTGLPVSAHVTTGVTDSCASQISSGAIKPGDWNTTIGTTLVLKGVTKSPVADRQHRIYNHKHPEGYWMPGGASNTGADWVALDYSDEELDRFNRAAAGLIPTPWAAYPLKQTGERFPFVAPGARGFEPAGLTPSQTFAARMEGTAYIERLSYSLIERLSGERASRIYTAGGASNSATWLRIRSHVAGVPIVKMKHASGAAGAAILAASKTYFANLTEAGERMLVPEARYEPESASLRERYEQLYAAFVEQLEARGYMKDWEEGKN
ncbi:MULTISPECIES: FGGY-family carbohydrate kinase [Cohnella]|uniref:FGGY-family carbohydrate kinase n=1 Tax=Cohnella TaxID=329857 RepID=UPI0009BB049A|nr:MULTISPECIES: FGGY-family carbohydrate kinase [Cohnella]MBN2982449.1 FGGY-family carbohydrate kinase [Cohnella algarum]